jgi:O-acetyl-ADP-ribose deacetylase (regulator of RNase III)
MPLEIVRNDITKMKTDAIVNAANSRLKQGGGVCGAIFEAAGARELQAECDSIGHCDVGAAVITGGYALPAKHIIHAVGPVWQGGGRNEEKLLISCYTNALLLAKEHGCSSIAFPLISSGIFGYPKDKALQAAIYAIGSFLLENDMTVYLVVFDKASYTLGDKLFSSITQYIDDHYVETHTPRRMSRSYEVLRQVREMSAYNEQKSYQVTGKPQAQPRQAAAANVPRSLDDVVSQLDETFSQMLLRLIDEKGKKDTDVYKRANIDRKLFSKIRSNPNYQPSKNTAIALAVALELNMDEMRDLLCRAGFALSHSSKFDIIVEYFIKQGNYNIFEINEALFAFDQNMLGA